MTTAAENKHEILAISERLAEVEEGQQAVGDSIGHRGHREAGTDSDWPRGDVELFSYPGPSSTSSQPNGGVEADKQEAPSGCRWGNPAVRRRTLAKVTSTSEGEPKNEAPARAYSDLSASTSSVYPGQTQGSPFPRTDGAALADLGDAA